MNVKSNHENDYVLGTHDEEIARLGFQHGVWRSTVLDCWRNAGINTAPWKVLAALPMVLDAGGKVNATANAELAKAIVYFRDTDSGYRRDTADRALIAHGPFKSLFELNEVVDTRPDALRNLSAFPGPGSNYGFRNGYGTIDLNGGADPDVRAGDTSPGVPGETDRVRGDFEEYFLVLNRISNLVTTRSDSFTCYVYVMGVEHDGTPQAALKVQRRVAFIADRSAIRPLRPVVRTQFISNE